MGFGSFLKSIFSGSSAAAQARPADPVDYNGFTIEAAPIDEDGKFRTAGYISGERDGETRRVQFIRADQNSELQRAIEHSIAKARQIIDEQGAGLLDKTQL
jgi:hypothetical protein